MPQGKGTPCLAEKPFGKLHKCLCTCLGFSAKVCVELCWFLGLGLVKESSRVSQGDTVVTSVRKEFPWRNKTVTVNGVSLVVKTPPFHCRGLVQSLARELRSHMPCSVQSLSRV